MCVGIRDIERILRCASEAGITDVHMTADEPVFWRRGDVLSPLKQYVPDGENIFAFVRQYFPKRIQEKIIDGENANLTLRISSWRYRVHCYSKRGRMAMAIRVMPLQLPELADLGQAGLVGQFAAYQQGLLLVTGATGAGKSTTVAALLEELNRHSSLHILTLEDPIEYELYSDASLISQLEREVDFQSYGRAVENAMRQAPDVIMVSEMRDMETVHAVLNAAVSGHYVIATMHAGSVIEAVERIISMYPAEKQSMAKSLLAASLRGICTQKLLPGRHGLKVCAVECLRANDAVRNIIRSGKYDQLYSIMETGAAEGMQTMALAEEKLRLGNLLKKERLSGIKAG